MTKKKCVHIIIRDKFTSGYINFLKLYDFNYEHTFFTFEGNYDLNLSNNSNVIIVNNYQEIYTKYANILDECNKIIIAALFDDAFSLLLMPKRYWDKTYIQFWGGDIYRFNTKRSGLISSLKQEIARFLTKKCIQKSAGILTLVKGDYEAIKRIFGIKKEYRRVVQVPDDFYEINHLDYQGIIKKTKYHGKKRILIGNSATIENKHVEIFNILKDKINSNYEVVVPLSYGDDKYREEILIKGKELLKDSFIPILNFMKRDDYISLLSTCDVAIFNNNRQQATGNIIILANLGAKLYLRDDTSMWEFFTNLGFNLHNVKDLNNEDINTILEYKDNEKENNYLALKKMENEAIDQWGEFLNG